ncbi:hypothetical protein LIER_24991 [Lithospermum erythrorhizon]|uniref:Uncharacterized protein n=1 Tax=Lithospermum erythrorhizon TaxID=34254 RepID=A0AAV3R6U4_LITER
MEESVPKSPNPKRRSALDRIRAPDRGYFKAYLPHDISRLQDEKMKKEVKERKIEYLTALNAFVGNIP